MRPAVRDERAGVGAARDAGGERGDDGDRAERRADRERTGQREGDGRDDEVSTSAGARRGPDRAEDRAGDRAVDRAAQADRRDAARTEVLRHRAIERRAVEQRRLQVIRRGHVEDHHVEGAGGAREVPTCIGDLDLHRARYEPVHVGEVEESEPRHRLVELDDGHRVTEPMEERRREEAAAADDQGVAACLAQRAGDLREKEIEALECPRAEEIHTIEEQRTTAGRVVDHVDSLIGRILRSENRRRGEPLMSRVVGARRRRIEMRMRGDDERGSDRERHGDPSRDEREHHAGRQRVRSDDPTVRRRERDAEDGTDTASELDRVEARQRGRVLHPTWEERRVEGGDGEPDDDQREDEDEREQAARGTVRHGETDTRRQSELDRDDNHAPCHERAIANAMCDGVAHAGTDQHDDSGHQQHDLRGKEGRADLARGDVLSEHERRARRGEQHRIVHGRAGVMRHEDRRPRPTYCEHASKR